MSATETSTHLRENPFSLVRAQLARNGRAMAESLTWDNAIGAREELLYRIHANQMPASLRGFQTGIVDGYGMPFESLTADFAAQEGALLAGEDGEHYLVESGSLRRVSNPGSLGFNPNHVQQVDLLTLLRNTRGPDITSPADYYGLGAQEGRVAAQ